MSAEPEAQAGTLGTDGRRREREVGGIEGRGREKLSLADPSVLAVGLFSICAKIYTT